MIIFDYQCDSVSSMAITFQNHAAASQHPLPILITDGEKIIVLYATFTYISSQCQKYLQIFILWAEIGSLSILFNSILFKIVYGNSLYHRALTTLFGNGAGAFRIGKNSVVSTKHEKKYNVL